MTSYLQSTATECGPACLGYIASHYGCPVEMNELRTRFPVSMRGTSLANLIQLARTLGLQARPLRLDLEDLPKLSLPCVLHWNMNHFVVLVRYSHGKLTVHDPARGERRMTAAEASPHFTGVALELSPSPDFARVKPKPPISWRQLIGTLYGLKRSLSQLFLLAACLQVLLLISPLFTQWIVDGAIVSGDEGLLTVLLIGLCLTTLIRVGLESARGWLGIVASVQFGTQWATRVMRHLLRLPAQWFEVRHTGDVISRFQSMQSIQQTVTGKLVEIMLDGLFALITLAVMLLYSAKLAVVVIAAMLAYAAIRVLPHGVFHRVNDEALTHEAKAQTYFLENLRAIQAIKIAELEEQRTVRWMNLIIQAANRRTSTHKMTLAFGAGYGLVFGVESIAVLGWGASMAINGTLTVGMLMAFVVYKDEFSSRMQRFIDNFMGIRMLRLHVERLSDIVLAEPEELAESMFEESQVQDGQGPTIRLDNVSFRYGSDASWVFRNVNLSIKPGEHVAIVGPTGCGKTTLAKIILGLLEPTEGTVRIDEIPIKQFGIRNWRRQIAAVMQDDQLFSSSLQENITGFDENADGVRVQAVSNMAAIHDEVMAMPMGYHTLVGDMGSGLSGGQKQRILLARALYRQPDVLVLDEATSHLDVNKERLVNESIRRLQKTRVTIAHRPETIAMADRVIELDGASTAA
ncbi:peptidase domain-containing ABC transporter [Cupriavidus basilensis]|uniref:peptidase domain-containing ABC transporter n=1 Tax=Cupriavidus basilensis TaxID=68895 RepID=UPI0023E88EEB|nr:peptidase domain-containing ABC transporter [Cupriavidus basilensis]MDF3887179.1 peptidase domain-containing ABC transporter [Cupriavidus basilensis]